MNTNTDLNTIFTKFVEKIFVAPKGPLNFFKAGEDTITDALIIEYDTQKSRKVVAKAKKRGSKATLNGTGAFTNYSHQPPVYKEEKIYTIQEKDLRGAGEQFYENDPSRQMKLIKQTAKDIKALSEKINKSLIWQACQVFSTGKIAFSTAGYSENVSDIDFECPAAHFATLSNAGTELYWNNASADPLLNMESHCRLIRLAGGSPIKNVIFGRTAWHNFKVNKKVLAELENLRVNYGSIDPQVPGMDGLGFKGSYYIDQAQVNFWTYDETYISPDDNTTEVEYIDPTHVIFLADGEYELWFAGIDVIKDISDLALSAFLPGNGNVSFVGDRVASSLYVDARVDKDLDAVLIRVQQAPLCIPKTNDTFGRLKVLA